MNANSFNRLPLATLVAISFLFATGCASVSTSQTETDDAYFNSADIQKEKEAASIAALKQTKQETNTPATSTGSDVDYVNPNYKASGKYNSSSNTSGNNYTDNSFNSGYSSPYYSGYYSGGYSWMPGPYNYGSSFSMCYPMWYGSGWGSSLILGTRPYNPWMMNSGFGMGYGMNYGMNFGNSFYYNAYDPFYSPAFGYYGYNPFSSWYYSPYSSYYTPYHSGNYFNPATNPNEPSAGSGLVKTNLPISGMTSGDANATGGRFGTPVRGGRMNTSNPEPGGQPVVNNPNTPQPTGRPNSSIFRHESNSGQGQVVVPQPVNNNQDHSSDQNSGFWRNENNDFFRSQNTGTGSGHSSGGSGTGNTTGGGTRGGAQMTGGRRR